MWGLWNCRNPIEPIITLGFISSRTTPPGASTVPQSTRQLPRIVRHPRPRPAAAMEHLKTRFILSIPFIVLGFLLTNAPFMMTSVTPSRPWADGPMKLVTTPQFLTKKVLYRPPHQFPACMLRLGC